MKHLPGIVLAALLGLPLWAGPATALSVVERDFGELVDRAELVLVGTASEQHSYADPAGGPRPWIYTDITFTDLEFIKGEVPSTHYTLRISGGRVAGRALDIPGLPRFKTGERYLIFVKGNGRLFFPVVGVHQGMFQILRQSGGPARVLDAGGKPVVAILGRHVVTAPTTGRAAQREAMTLEAFTARIRGRLHGGGQP
ncbi:MAG TPA: hypothetical protein ENJ19_10365 [Gammaproteobacteria bacterium]|nr:hypothetical protein [Gammaproteobacteria bacterium]